MLLGRKKTGLGAGNFVGIGGKIEQGELPVDAVVREVLEEATVTVRSDDLTLMGRIRWVFPYQDDWEMRAEVFHVEHWQGEPRETDEIAPEWFAIDSLPLQNMWDDARFWLPRILAGKQLEAFFSYAADNATVEQHRLRFVSF